MHATDIDKKLKDNTGLIYKQLGRFYLVRDPEAISTGYEALHNAILTFDESKGYTFSTYATICIYNALGCYVRTLNKKRQIRAISLNTPIYNADGKQSELQDVVADTVDIEKAAIQEEQEKRIHNEIRKHISEYTNETQKAIVLLWYESNFEMTMTAIGAKANVSQSYVSVTLAKFKKDLRKRLKSIL